MSLPAHVRKVEWVVGWCRSSQMVLEHRAGQLIADGVKHGVEQLIDDGACTQGGVNHYQQCLGMGWIKSLLTVLKMQGGASHRQWCLSTGPNGQTLMLKQAEQSVSMPMLKQVEWVIASAWAEGRRFLACVKSRGRRAERYIANASAGVAGQCWCFSRQRGTSLVHEHRHPGGNVFTGPSLLHLLSSLDPGYGFVVPVGINHGLQQEISTGVFNARANGLGRIWGTVGVTAGGTVGGNSRGNSRGNSGGNSGGDSGGGGTVGGTAGGTNCTALHGIILLLLRGLDRGQGLFSSPCSGNEIWIVLRKSLSGSSKLRQKSRNKIQSIEPDGKEGEPMVAREKGMGTCHLTGHDGGQITLAAGVIMVTSQAGQVTTQRCLCAGVTANEQLWKKRSGNGHYVCTILGVVTPHVVKSQPKTV
ncbi:hypothetical protein EI94DRAFT_1702363 [Lactarius quietus]|nr:hypothetical protein EI94DRAFT_1702363 [Lactarius quietus]